MRKRDWKFNVYLNEEEKAMLKQKAEKTGLTYSTLIRFLITDFRPKEKPNDEFYEALNAVKKVGNVLNQIAIRMHVLGYVDNEKLLKTTIDRLNDLISNIKDYYLMPDKVK